MNLHEWLNENRPWIWEIESRGKQEEVGGKKGKGNMIQSYFNLKKCLKYTKIGNQNMKVNTFI